MVCSEVKMHSPQCTDAVLLSGDLSMRSEGRPGVDEVFSVHKGILMLEVDKSTYERVGLEGKAIPDGGRKHKPHRFSIEIDLGSTSMVHGKRGFERVVEGLKEEGAAKGLEGPISKHHPMIKTSKPSIRHMVGVEVPPFQAITQGEDLDASRYADKDDATDLQEWLGLVALQSPRVLAADATDGYLSRYRVPGVSAPQDDGGKSSAQDLVCLRYHGFLPASTIMKMLIAARRAARNHWAALTTSDFSDLALDVLLVPPEGYYLEWQSRQSP
ncbi:MAG: hypothetical protein M1828_002766 [Chrysothrix sp. TS-e1954]|nr:MAG: hypothetical protein M1828_002766 [Chrysothrix sp. TS-e1954]